MEEQEKNMKVDENTNNDEENNKSEEPDTESEYGKPGSRVNKK